MKLSRKYSVDQSTIGKWILIAFVCIALLAPLLANEKPLIVSISGKTFFPAFNNNPYSLLPDSSGSFKKILAVNVNWKNLKTDYIVFPPVAWSPVKSDMINSFVSPFGNQYLNTNGIPTELPIRYRHFLGTGKTGNDLLAGLIHGCRTSLLIGVLAVSIALFLGMLLGGFAGYLGDDKLKTNYGSLLLFFLLLLPAWFYSFYLRMPVIEAHFNKTVVAGTVQILISFVIFCVLTCWPFLIKFRSTGFFRNTISIPVDSIISRTIEIFLSLPKLILILTIAALTKPSLETVILIIGLTSWPEIARIVRAQILTLREMNYIAAAKSMGNNTVRIIWVHLIPNAITPISVMVVFGIASAVLYESALSFLGAGVPADIATWGSLMYQARENYLAWWLVLFSGLAIFALLFSLNSIGNKFKTAENNKTYFNKF